MTRYISQVAYEVIEQKSRSGWQLLAYAKPKQKYQSLNGYPFDNYKEREQRRVEVQSIKRHIEESERKSPLFSLHFSVDDIVFIIVKTEVDKINLINAINSWETIGGKENKDTLMLCSKILTKKDIKSNF